jgi:hypothetical protein
MIGIVRIEIVRSITKEPKRYSIGHVAYCSVAGSGEEIN